MPDQLGSPGLCSLSFWHLRLPPFLTAIRAQLSGLIVFSREVSLVGRRHECSQMLMFSQRPQTAPSMSR